MKRSLLSVVAVLVVLVPAHPAGARLEEAYSTTKVSPPGSRSPIVVFYDDMESGLNGWTSQDNTLGPVPKFHVDTYYAHEGSSWWCGEINQDFVGGGEGYANSWDMRLDIPPVSVTDVSQPVLTFAFRHYSEVDHDYTWVQAESLGTFVDLNLGYHGKSGGWQDLGPYGLPLAAFDDPFVGRFRFIADGAWSDEDGLYDSEAGGFHCDNIKVYDYVSGAVLFFDDCETRGLCVPSVPPPAGDWWHLVERKCQAYSDPHTWWCGDDADTGLIPPGLNNSIISPAVNITGSNLCTLRFLLHAEVPTVDNDYWTEDVSVDGGSTWTRLGAWWGDSGQCGGWGTHGVEGIDLSDLMPGSSFRFRLTMHTTDDGCGPAESGGAGIMLDDLWLVDWTGTAVTETTWGQLKALYRN
jgi:hypothetical protein